ncbi:GNAT family N-acetyltransferase [Micromonospora sp. IBHARD004]|uniref:GNAT family N-acetyltransferase n=1 Tax=Micromonospora sp. IBHARD004 TaxID=3457764 RepID=UPI004059C7E8
MRWPRLSGSRAGWLGWPTSRIRRSRWTPARCSECTYRWIVEGDQVLGAIALRHELNDFLLRVGGHIGYGIRPSARRRGLATWALSRMLGEARVLGLDRVLVICEVNNIASAKTIEHHGGVLEDIRDTELGTARRYWIKIWPTTLPSPGPRRRSPPGCGSAPGRRATALTSSAGRNAESVPTHAWRLV